LVSSFGVNGTSLQMFDGLLRCTYSNSSVDIPNRPYDANYALLRPYPTRVKSSPFPVFPKQTGSDGTDLAQAKAQAFPCWPTCLQESNALLQGWLRNPQKYVSCLFGFWLSVKLKSTIRDPWNTLPWRQPERQRVPKLNRRRGGRRKVALHLNRPLPWNPCITQCNSSPELAFLGIFGD
jgi:hypothetical protein